MTDDFNFNNVKKAIVLSETETTITELQHGNTLFKIDDLVRTVPSWYTSQEEIKQGRIIGFHYFEYKREMIPQVEIELLTGEYFKIHPSNIEKIDDSWFEMC